MKGSAFVLLATLALGAGCAGDAQDADSPDAGGAPTAASCEALTSSEACHAAGCSAFVDLREVTVDEQGTCGRWPVGARCLLTTTPWPAAWSGMPSYWYRSGDAGKGEVMSLGGLLCDVEIVGWKACTGAEGEPSACACGAPYIRC